jgi:hypothetical protein
MLNPGSVEYVFLKLVYDLWNISALLYPALGILLAS